MAKKYCNYNNFIVEIQHKLLNFDSFRQQFDKYNKLDIASGIIALGNLCQIKCVKREEKDFVKRVVNYAFKNTRHNRIHICGLSLRMYDFVSQQEKLHNVEASVDSSSWTMCSSRKCKVELHKSLEKPIINNGLRTCSKETRQLFFNEYLKKVQKRDQHKYKDITKFF